jgi:hypothetical protein
VTPVILKKDGQRGDLWIEITLQPDGVIVEQAWRETGSAPRKRTTNYPPDGTPDQDRITARVKEHTDQGYVPSALPDDLELKWLTFSATLEESDKQALIERVGLHWLCADITTDPSSFPDMVGGFKVNYSALGTAQISVSATTEEKDPWSDVELQRLATFLVTVDHEAKVVDGDDVLNLLKSVVGPGVRSGKWDPMQERVLTQLGICSQPVKFTSAVQEDNPFAVCL